jgi:hypothetical protein
VIVAVAPLQIIPSLLATPEVSVLANETVTALAEATIADAAVLEQFPSL